MCIRLKGDGKPYQFRVKRDVGQYFSYKFTFKTSGYWETIEIPLEEMIPVYRGRNLDKPNFSADKIEQVVFLIGNKKKEQFELLLDAIVLR